MKFHSPHSPIQISIPLIPSGIGLILFPGNGLGGVRESCGMICESHLLHNMLCNQYNTYTIKQCKVSNIRHKLIIPHTTVMPKQKQSDNEKQNKQKNHSLAAEWTTEDIDTLIDTLHDLCCSHRTDGNSSSFKPQAWWIVVDALEKVHTKGGAKNSCSCSDKWKSVSLLEIEEH